MRETGFFLALVCFFAGVFVGYTFQIWIIVVLSFVYLWLIIEIKKCRNPAPFVELLFVGYNIFMLGMWSMAIIMRWNWVIDKTQALNPVWQSTKEFFKNYILR